MYWERDQEITLLNIVLEALDPAEDRGTADTIICGLIDMGIVDCERAPNAHQMWCDVWDGRDVPRDFVAKWYMTDDEHADALEDAS